MADLSLITLDRIAQRITSTLDLGEVLESITSALVLDLGAALARIWLLEGDTLVLRASSGLSVRLDGTHARVSRDDRRKIAEIARTAQPIWSNDLGSDPRIVDKAWVARESVQSFAGHPLIFRGETLGVLASFARRKLSDADLEGLALLARWAAIAVQNARSFAEVSAENAYLREDTSTEIVGKSAALRGVLDSIAQVAKTDSTVLLLGETGTGKELFARALHEKSNRRSRALVKVNCAAVPATLVESELFGHEKGAFTGAERRRLGKFELANGGTLFLDEVGELAIEAQPKLLRALQEREVERVGGSSAIPIVVRVVAATHRDLEADVRTGRFRADLFYRLNVFPITIPPLRARREDIPLLADTFLRHHARRLGKPLVGFTTAAMSALGGYDWPGNVRELQNVVERAAILSSSKLVDVVSLPSFARAVPEPRPEPLGHADLEEVERRHITRVLGDHDWVIEGAGGAAAALGLKPSTLRSRIAKLGIRRPR
ncbi:MAG: sigma-54-dependent Fis family transcriptional regulator [Polyangiales bacterium]